MTRKYDARGELVEEACYGTDGEPTLSDEGWSRITYVNDDLGRAIERAHFGVRGEPVIGKDERYHRGKRSLDERGNPLEVAFFGTDGWPIAIADSNSKRHCAWLVSRWAAKGTEMARECFDASGRLIP